MTVVPFGRPDVGSGQTASPSASMTFRIVVRGISTPPFAIAPYAPSRSIGWTSSVPMPIEVDRQRARHVVDPEVLRPLEEVVEAVDQPGLDRGDVQRELEGRAEADRAALEVVGLGRREPPAEVGHDVHEHRRRGHRPVVDADRVVDRLDRRSGLAPAVGQDVELGLELRVAGAV